MGLEHFEVERKEIPFKGGSFTVRGLNAEDLAGIVGQNITVIEELYQKFTNARAAIFSQRAVDGFILKMIAEAPAVVAEVISRAAEQPELKDKAAKLPLAVQAAALAEIFRFTVEDSGGLKNLLAALTSLVQEGLPESVRQALAPQTPVQ